MQFINLYWTCRAEFVTSCHSKLSFRTLQKYVLPIQKSMSSAPENHSEQIKWMEAMCATASPIGMLFVGGWSNLVQYAALKHHIRWSVRHWINWGADFVKMLQRLQADIMIQLVWNSDCER